MIIFLSLSHKSPHRILLPVLNAMPLMRKCATRYGFGTAHTARKKTFMAWMRHFLRFVNGKNPEQVSSRDLHYFLNSLAIEKKESVSTQNQALNALVFMFRYALEKDINQSDKL